MISETVWLQRPGVDIPWGFRLHGGRDYQSPLSIQKVTPGSIAATGLSQGDVILRIGETMTSSLTYAQAMDVIKNSGNLLQLSISKQSNQGSYSPQVDRASNMSSSGALHDLFQDLYRYTDPYEQEGAHSHTQAAPPTSYAYQPSHGGGDFDHYGRQTYHQPYNYGANTHASPVPPTYADVQTHRDQVAYPYQSSQSSHNTPTTPSYPYQPSQPYPHSMSSSTSELSDVSSGFGATDARRVSPSMMSPHAQGYPRAYTSGSSADSSSGIGSYNCEVPDHSAAVYTPQAVSRQDSYPLPPPPEASDNHGRQSYGDEYPDVQSDPVVAPPPSAPAPPPPPPPPPLPKSWKAQPTDSHCQPSTRLEQQLASMNMDSGYGRQRSYPYQSPEPISPAYPPPPPPTAPYYGGAAKPMSPVTPPTPKQHVMPDAVLNMAAKGGPDKKPFAYAPDADIIKEQRDKVRRRTPGGSIPRYQQMLNLPQFEDPPKHRGHVAHSPSTPTSPPQYAPGPGDTTVAHLQYNSPLPMYTEDNVGEAFAGQTDGVVTRVGGLKKDQGPDVTQSPVYRMIHGIDNDKPRQRVVAHPSGEGQRQPRRPADDDELCFSGVLDRADIPSKSFHRLQSMTGSSDSVDTSSIRHNVSGDGTDEQIGDYDQASIRYTGKNIPSKSFRMLQSMTGEGPSASGSELTVPGHQRRIRRPRPQEEEAPQNNPDDIVDISYVGGNIPSRSFKVLQQSVGADCEPGIVRDDDYYDEDKGDAGAYDDMYYMGENIPSRSFQLLQSVVGNDPHAVAQERRQRRRKRITSRQSSMVEEEVAAVQADHTFDEEAYLAGQIPLKIAADQPKPKRAARSTSRDAAPWQKENEKNDQNDQSQDFDEEAYLSGRISILGNDSKVPPRPTASELIPQLTEYEPEQKLRDFDEDAYLLGKISLLGGDAKPIKREQKAEEEPEWVKKRRQQLAKKKREPQEVRPENMEAMVTNKQEKPTDSGPVPCTEPFDEDAYLAGMVTFLGGNPVPPKPNHREKPKEPAASWQKPTETTEEKITDDKFDEDAYLQGKVPILRDSVEKELPPRAVDKPKKFRERAPWERANEENFDPDVEFDENLFLAGRSPYVRKSVDRDSASPATANTITAHMVNGTVTPTTPTGRTVHYLRRTMSREITPVISNGSYNESSDDDQDANKAYNEMVYVGKNIPSKSFLRLQKSMSRKGKETKDPLDHIKQRMADAEVVDKAIENLRIGQHNPDEYLEKLKQTVQQNNNIKIEAIPDAVTDF